VIESRPAPFAGHDIKTRPALVSYTAGPRLSRWAKACRNLHSSSCLIGRRQCRENRKRCV